MEFKKMKRVLIAIALICLVVSPALAERGVTKDTIKLGLILVKTGPVAALGLPDGHGMVDYMRYLNDQGGVHGRKVEVIWEDDEFQAPKSVAALKKLIHRDKVLSLITTGGSNQTIANMKTINKYRISNIPNALMREFFDPYQPYIFAMGATYECQYQCIVDYIFDDMKAEKPRIGVLYAKKEYGKIGLKAIRERAKAYGVDLVSELVLPTGAVDASSQVLTLQKNRVDYVITCDVLPPVISFLKTAEKYSYKPKAVFGFNWATDDMIVKACGKGAENYIGVNFVGGWGDDSPGMKLVRDIAKAYGRDPKSLGLTSLYIHGVGASYLFGEAFKRAGKDLNPDSLKAAFETFQDVDTGGIFPPLTYTDKSHAPPEMVKLFKADVPNKRLVSITDWRTPKKID
ncbi:MAG: ABC transporter substrate-binding protein [Desulfatiglans sp.]|jgi:branched-chain amino acid transport system substrate-binding protein|nr:ABC transporter substrate-binding protein [Thermodesulfobacteriota bacterium]MEE4353120.1 ABC transporter substrate-binding protein [Desulfatiglans sp.]